MVKPILKRVLRTARLAFNREGPFRVISSERMPNLWEKFRPELSMYDARKLCRTYYLDLLLDVRGSVNFRRRQLIQSSRAGLIGKATGPFQSAGAGGDTTNRKDCVSNAKRLLRKTLRPGGWLREGGGDYSLDTSVGRVSIAMDAGTHRSYPEIHFWLPEHEIRLPSEVLFSIWTGRYLRYQDPEDFTLCFEGFLALTIILGNELRRE